MVQRCNTYYKKLKSFNFQIVSSYESIRQWLIKSSPVLLYIYPEINTGHKNLFYVKVFDFLFHPQPKIFCLVSALMMNSLQNQSWNPNRFTSVWSFFPLSLISLLYMLCFEDKFVFSRKNIRKHDLIIALRKQLLIPNIYQVVEVINQLQQLILNSTFFSEVQFKTTN